MAQLQQAAAAPDSKYTELQRQLQPSLPVLRTCWLAFLRDFALLETQPKAARRAHKPFFYAANSPTESRNQIAHAWYAKYDKCTTRSTPRDSLFCRSPPLYAPPFT